MRFTYRHYRSGNWCSYQTIFHDDRDEPLQDNLAQLLSLGLKDGDIVEVEVKVVGKAPRVWELTEPHTYNRVDIPLSRGCPECQKEDNK